MHTAHIIEVRAKGWIRFTSKWQWVDNDIRYILTITFLRFLIPSRASQKQRTWVCPWERHSCRATKALILNCMCACREEADACPSTSRTAPHAKHCTAEDSVLTALNKYFVLTGFNKDSVLTALNKHSVLTALNKNSVLTGLNKNSMLTSLNKDSVLTGFDKDSVLVSGR